MFEEQLTLFDPNEYNSLRAQILAAVDIINKQPWVSALQPRCQCPRCQSLGIH